MSGLILKDLKILKNQQRFFLIILFIGIMLVCTNVDLSFFISYATFIFSLFTLSTLSYDEFDNGMPFLLTLPVSRRDFVREKYIFGLMMTIASWSCATAIGIVVTIVKSPQTNILEFIASNVPFVIVVIVLLCVMIPIEIKFGAEKGRMAMIAVGGAVFIVGFLIGMLVKALNVDINSLVSWFLTLSNAVVVLFIALIGVVALAVSYCASVKIMYKKEY